MITTHPFRGKIRSIEEIAEIIGKPASYVESYIRRGEPIPVPARVLRQPIDDGRAATLPTPQRGPGAKRIPVYVDGMRYDSADDCAKAFGIKVQTLRMIRQGVVAEGRTLTAQDLQSHRKQPVTIDGITYEHVFAAAEAMGCHYETLREKVRKARLTGSPLTASMFSKCFKGRLIHNEQ